MSVCIHMKASGLGHTSAELPSGEHPQVIHKEPLKCRGAFKGGLKRHVIAYCNILVQSIWYAGGGR